MRIFQLRPGAVLFIALAILTVAGVALPLGSLS
jgi:hypothetical protein